MPDFSRSIEDFDGESLGTHTMDWLGSNLNNAAI